MSNFPFFGIFYDEDLVLVGEGGCLDFGINGFLQGTQHFLPQCPLEEVFGRPLYERLLEAENTLVMNLMDVGR